MKILAIDPGPEQSAAVVWSIEDSKIIAHWQCLNRLFRAALHSWKSDIDMCVIEDMEFYGKVMNSSSFDTLKFIGMVQEIFYTKHHLVIFPEIALHFCNSRNRVKTSNINAVLVHRFGGKGTKKNPGLFYGIKEHEWSAVAVAVYYYDVHIPF